MPAKRESNTERAASIASPCRGSPPVLVTLAVVGSVPLTLLSSHKHRAQVCLRSHSSDHLNRLPSFSEKTHFTVMEMTLNTG